MIAPFCGGSLPELFFSGVSSLNFWIRLLTKLYLLTIQLSLILEVGGGLSPGSWKKYARDTLIISSSPTSRVNKTVEPPPTLLMAQKLGWLTYWDGGYPKQGKHPVACSSPWFERESNLCSFGVPLGTTATFLLYMTKNRLVDPGYIFILPKPSTGATKLTFFNWASGIGSLPKLPSWYGVSVGSTDQPSNSGGL